MPNTERHSVLVRPESFVLSAPDGSVLTFDRAGRLYSAFMDGRFYRRGVDGRVVEKFTAGEPVRRLLAAPQARAIEVRALRLAAQVPGAQDLPLIADLEADAARFRAVYEGSIPILPPDRYRALVLQATVGCSYNACRFCHFYRDRSFRVRSREEFRRHAARVRAVFGEGISMRRGVFLGDADALAADTDLLLSMCGVAASLPPGADGLSSFGAVSAGPRRTVAEWRDLRATGLRHVYLGIETGHDPLRRRLNKPGTADEALRLVEELKEAGMRVGLIFLLGVGGDAVTSRHVKESVALCHAAPLDAGDLVYLSPLATGSGRLVRGRCEEDARIFRTQIGERARVAIYDIRTFVY